MKTYAVLLAPEFKLQAALRHAPTMRREPVVLLEIEGAKSRVRELNDHARSHQIERGMTPTQARARCERLHFLHGNAGHERSAMEALLQVAETFSPYLEVTEAGVVTLELPPEHLPTEKELLEKCVAPLQAMGLDIRIGIAGTPSLALLAARFAQPICLVDSPAIFLAPLPVEFLQPSAEILAVLTSWGIHTIGQLAALPMSEVCSRLGLEVVALWEQAHGGRNRPLRHSKPPEFYAEQTELEHPVETLEPLLFVLRRFLEQITRRLALGYLVAGKLRLVLRFEQGAIYRRTFTLPQPTGHVDLLFRMLQTHLENFTSESPIIAIELAAKPVRPTTEQFDLMEKGLRDPHQFAETLARLQALLGSDRLGSPEVESSHHPDAFHLRPYPNPAAPAPTEELLLGIPWLRFRPAIPARVVLNELQPAFVYSQPSTGPIKDARGPWRLEGRWWEEGRWSREDWDIVTEDGIYRLIRAGEQWFLDGIYA